MLEHKMTCPLQTDHADVLLDYSSRALDAERTAMLERHMESCVECRQVVEAQTAVWSALDAYDAQPISPDFDERLYARIAAMERVPFWERVWAPVREYLQGQPAWKPVLPVAVAACALAVVFVVRTDSGAAKVAAPVDAQVLEQAERALEDIDMLRQFDAVEDPANRKKSETKKEIL